MAKKESTKKNGYGREQWMKAKKEGRTKQTFNPESNKFER